MEDKISNVVIKETTYKGSNISGWEILKFKLSTISISGVNPQTRINKAMCWCANNCKVGEYYQTVYEVVGITNKKCYESGIYPMVGMDDVL